MLELGKAGSAGTDRGTLPVLADGAVVATLSSARWREAATAKIGAEEWLFAKRKRELTGRWATDPDGSVRLRARQVSAWKGTWELDLEGTTVRLRPASRWKGTYTVELDGRAVGELGSTGSWSRRPTLTADRPLALHQQVFLLWVQLIVQRRAAAAAASAA